MRDRTSVCARGGVALRDGVHTGAVPVATYMRELSRPMKDSMRMGTTSRAVAVRPSRDGMIGAGQRPARARANGRVARLRARCALPWAGSLVAGVLIALLLAGPSRSAGEDAAFLELVVTESASGEVVVDLKTSSPLPRTNVFTLVDPARLVVDLSGAQSALLESQGKLDVARFIGFRTGVHNGKLRVVLDGSPPGTPIGQYREQARPDGLRLVLPMRTAAVPGVVPRERADLPPGEALPTLFETQVPVDAVPYEPPTLPAGMPLPPLPEDDGLRHLGVSSCAGSPCHGSAVERGSAVLQTEYIIWRGQDRHSVAYSALFNDQSKKVARNLGYSTPPHETKLCLDCHADNVPARLRAGTFSLEDGVGCESCHGGGERYLAGHDYLQTNAQNLEQGMYPTDDPVARAELCLSCHYGSASKEVTHRLIGAGHPRLTFELQTFTVIQPAHFRMGRDGVEKATGSPAGIAVWATGQAVAGRKLLKAFISGHTSVEGIWTEFTRYNCYSCHQPVNAQTWLSDTRLPQGAGIPGINTANLEMVGHAVRGTDPQAWPAYDRALRALRRSPGDPAMNVREAAQTLHRQLEAAIPKFGALAAEPASVQATLDLVVDGGAGVGRHDFLYAEQAVMAAQVLIDQLDAVGGMGAVDVQALRRRMGALLDGVADPETYDAAGVGAKFRALRASLP